MADYLVDGKVCHLDKIASEYMELVRYKRIYDQIRFIDLDGQEVVRVNFNSGHPEVVASSKLQNKRNRYYFKDCFDMDKGEIFISPFDLNVEHGHIETPLKPMIRVGTPVFDADGRKRGIVLINYLGADLLAKLAESEQLSEGLTMLLNEEGYWLYSSDDSQAWGFMFKDTKRSFFYQYPTVWKAIGQQQRGQVLAAEGLFTFRDIFPLREVDFFDAPASHAVAHRHGRAECREYHWYLVSFSPKQLLDKFAAYLMMKLFSFGAGVFFIIALGSWLLAFAITKRRIYQARLKTMALCDVLTGLPNRRLFYDRLALAIEHGKRYNRIFAVIFVDLDGFKKVNDSLGHEAGDALLCEVARRLRQSIRKSDTVARMGGDEFALIVEHVRGEEETRMIAGKIIECLSAPMLLAQGEVQVGASVGISLFPLGSENGEELLKQADQAMYRSKCRGTNRYSFFSGEPEPEPAG